MEISKRSKWWKYLLREGIIFSCLLLLSVYVFWILNIHFKDILKSKEDFWRVLTLDKEKTVKSDSVTKGKDEHVKSKTQVKNYQWTSFIEGAKPWFFRAGYNRPQPWDRKNDGEAKLSPEQAPGDDRIINQLMYIPPASREPQKKLKEILLYDSVFEWDVPPGRRYFLNAKCPVNTCSITSIVVNAPNVDAVIYKDNFYRPNYVRPRKQVLILYYLESPYETRTTKYIDYINWTATYRHDSDIVAPYQKWAYYDPKVKQNKVQGRNYAANKTKAVAWFVSNCNARNNRFFYANELRNYIDVDIFGNCGMNKCPRFPESLGEECFQKLDKEYRFYLAFENANCRDYITEKFFENGLGRNVLPIVMGAHPDDYARSAPEHSYIHVDDFKSPKELADYLHKLMNDDDLYNSYFWWKGTGEFINTRFLCRVCAMLHAEYPSKWYEDINTWWGGNGMCTEDSWRQDE